MTDSRPEFSVYQFFTPAADGMYECVRRFVQVDEAVKAFKHYSNNPAAQGLGIIDRVIITDGGDCIVAEWKKGEGVIWPPKDN